MNLNELSQRLKILFSSQGLAVLATQGKGGPYANLVAFATTHDLKHLVFATNRNTRKFANLTMSPDVAFLIDDRSNDVADFNETMAVTAMGSVREVKTSERNNLIKLYLTKHPNLEGFVTSSDCVLMITTIHVYYVVTNFQNVMELDVESWSLSSR